MFRHVKSLFGNSRQPAQPSPYGQSHLDFTYNLLFCDAPELYRGTPSAGVDPWRVLLNEDADAEAVCSLAEDESLESRIRCLAFNWLKRHQLPVPKGKLLGTIVEFGLDQGLDVLAAFQDGRIRYINHSGKMTVFETKVAGVDAAADRLLAASQPIVDRIGPSDKPRRPAPPKGIMRMTFLVSDGLYFGEGPEWFFKTDPLAAQVYTAAVGLLGAINAVAVK